MRFRISDGLLLVTSVLQDVADVPNIPIIIRLFLQEFDPHVWNCHAKPVIKSSTAFLHWTTQRRHPRHILQESIIRKRSTLHQINHVLQHYNPTAQTYLSNGDSLWVQLMQHVVGQHQVHQSLCVDVKPKVFIIITTETFPNAMGVIQHGGDAIKPDGQKNNILSFYIPGWHTPKVGQLRRGTQTQSVQLQERLDKYIYGDRTTQV